MLSPASNDASLVAVGAAETNQGPPYHYPQIRLASFDPWTSWPAQTLEPSVASSLECGCDPPILAMAPGTTDAHVAIAQTNCCIVPAPLLFTSAVGTDDGLPHDHLSMNPPEGLSAGPTTVLARGSYGYLLGYRAQDVFGDGVERLHLAQYESSSGTLSFFDSFGCGSQKRFVDAAGYQGGFIVGYSTSHLFGKCPDPSGNQQFSNKIVFAWLGPNGGGYGPLSTIIEEPSDYVQLLKLVPHSQGTWVVYRYAGATAEFPPPFMVMRLGSKGEQLLAPKAFPSVTDCDASLAFGQLADRLVVARADQCDPSPGNPLRVSLVRGDGTEQGTGISLPPQSKGPIMEAALIGSPAGDQLVVAWSETTLDNTREVFLARLRCVDAL